MAEPRASLSLTIPRGDVRAVVLVLHGGREHGTDLVRPTQLSVVRMLPFAHALRRRGAASGLAVARLRYRVRGWNGAGESPLADARWALSRIAERFGDVPVALVGYSMGARVAVAAAGDPVVRVVVALAPWLTDTDAVAGLAGRHVLFVHGSDDRTTSPRATMAFAERSRPIAASCSVVILARERHPMMRRPWLWHRLATEAVLTRLGLGEPPARPELSAGGGSSPRG